MVTNRRRNQKTKWDFRAMAVGKFIDEEHTIWSDHTKAYSSVKEYVEDIGTKQLYYIPLCEDLRVKPENLMEYLEQHDGIKEMCSLIKVLLAVHSNIAIKGFQRARDAENFLSLLEQLDYQVPADKETEALMTDIPPENLRKWTNLRHNPHSGYRYDDFMPRN